MSTTKVPFTIRLPRHLIDGNSTGNNIPCSPLTGGSPKRSAPDSADSSDEDENGSTGELITGFDRFGVQRYNNLAPPDRCCNDHSSYLLAVTEIGESSPGGDASA